MKKLIAISVMLALVAGAAFAQDLSIAAHTEFGTGILTQQNNAQGKSDAMRFGGVAFDQFALTVSKSGENAGGYMRFRNTSGVWGFYENGGQQSWRGGGWMAHIWWQPVDIFKFKVGSGDGDWGAAKISGWGWTQQAKLGGNIYGAAFDNRGFRTSGVVGFGSSGDGDLGLNFDKSVGFYPGTGWNTWRMGFSVYPIDGLDINLAFVRLGKESEFMNGGDGPFPINDIINKTHLNVQYALSGIGTLNVSAILGTGKSTNVTTEADGKTKTKGVKDPDATMKLFASFYLNAIDNMELDIGFAYQLAGKNEAGTTYTRPIEVGLGFTYGMGDFGVKLRAASKLMGQTKVSGASAVKDGTEIAVDILPYYNMGSTTIYFQAGMNMIMYDKKRSVNGSEPTKQIMGWFINPYVKFGPGGGIDLWTGLKLSGMTGIKKGPDVQWAVPLTVNVWMQ